MKNITHLILLAASIAALPVVPTAAQAATTSSTELRAAGTVHDLLPPPPPRPRPSLPVVAAVRG